MNKLQKAASLFCVILSLLLLPSIVSAAEPAEAKNYNLVINGENIVFSDEAFPLNSNGRILLPLRFLFDIINEDGTGTMDWDATTSQITMAYGETVVKLWIGDQKAEVNGSEVTIDGATPIIFKERTYVPLRFVADSFDMTINWDAPSATAFVRDNKTLDKIYAIWTEADEISEDESKMTMDISMNMSISTGSDDISELFDIDGALKLFDINMDGKIEQDDANNYEHVIMNIATYGIEGTFESYDDGEVLYEIFDGDVTKKDSKLSMDDGLSSQYGSFSTQDLNRELFTSFELTEDEENYIISGDMYAPEKLLDDIVSQVSDIGAGFETKAMSTSMRISDPINCKVVINKDSKLFVSMGMKFSIEMVMNDDEVEYSIYAKYDLNVPKIERGADFDTKIPEDIIARAYSVTE